jgi:parallel beta-helix repeat protein
MHSQDHIIFFLLALVLLTGCSGQQHGNGTDYEVLQNRLIMAQPGDTIRIDAGTYHLDRPLSLIGIDDVTIMGRGEDQTILSFAGQIEGAEGFLIKANRVAIENLSITDSKGDGLKVRESNGVTIRNVSVTWSDGPSESNGGYGIYPVSSKNVLIEHSEVSGASDAGIYVGQSEDVIVRYNTVYQNVAGIEIENCIRAEVYENDAYNNTGGILVFDLPDLMLKNGHDIQIHHNRIHENNHPNFAPAGNIVGTIPAGTGVLVMATDNVRIYNNEIHNHQTINTAVTSYILTGREFSDPEYNPYPSGVFIYNNNYSNTEALPDTTREMGRVLAALFASDVPDIIHDGVFNPAYILSDGSMASDKRICIGGNESFTLANINAPSGFQQVSADPEPYTCPADLYSQISDQTN